jgi:hypothetical protein
MWQNIQAYRTVTDNPCQHINVELLMVSAQDSFGYISQSECLRESVVMENFLRAKSSSATFGYTLYKLMEELCSKGGRVGPLKQCLP